MPLSFKLAEQFTIEDTAGRDASPEIRVETGSRNAWPELHVCGEDGHARGLISLDYHGGRLRVLVYDLTRSDAPKAAVTLAEADPPSLQAFLHGEPVL